MSEEKQEPKDESTSSERASKMMGDMFKGLKEFGHVAREKAEEFGKMASDKAEELTKQGKIKLDVHQLQRSRSKTLAELGELVFNLNKEDNLKGLGKHENFKVFVDSIVTLDSQIAEKAAQAQATATAPDEEADDEPKTEKGA